MSSSSRLGVVGDLAAAAKVLRHSGLVSPVRPDRMLGMALSFGRWGFSPAAAYAAGAARDPDRIAVIDEREAVSYAEIDRRPTAAAHALAPRGAPTGDAVALLPRDSAAFIIGQVAISKLGADTLYLNTGFAGPQLGDVLASEGATAIIAADGFIPLLDEVARDLPHLIAWSDDESLPDSVAAIGDETAPELPPPGPDGRRVILKSGTTAGPKGAARSAPGALAGLVELVAFLEAIPYKARGVTVLAA